MADISKIRIGDTDYDIKDEVARSGGGLTVKTFSKENCTAGGQEVSANEISIDGEPIAVLNAWTDSGLGEYCLISANEVKDGRVFVRAYSDTREVTGMTIYVNVLYQE